MTAPNPQSEWMSHAKAQRRKEEDRIGLRKASLTYFFAPLRLCVKYPVLLFWLAGVAVADEAAKTEPPLYDSDREHWAYVSPRRPPAPKVADEAWCRTPIDRFILAKLEAAGLQPAADADPATLLRRAKFDLTGLPPTVAEVDEFIKPRPSVAEPDRDQRSRLNNDTYAALVDLLLASHEHAERQAQHWLDLARYADTDGYEHDNVRPEAWRYRDWVIAAFAKNMPLDEFIRLQIAGDELQPDDVNAAIATGFLLCGPDMPDLNRQDERRSMVLNEITGTVGSTLLGLTLGCAECHDHKFEPYSQADFYRFRACFETASFLSRGRKEEDAAKDDERPDAMRVFREQTQEPAKNFLLVRGDFQRPGAELVAGFPRVANPKGATIKSMLASSQTSLGEGSGRRTALARWLTQPDHPLVPRVLVNRIWQQYFGRGLVGTPSDFGYLGDEPTHAELLDWLAVELVDHDWDVRHIERLIVTSSVYRQASRGTKPENVKLLAGFPRRRLDGEQLRDAMLAASGKLSERRGGPGIMTPLPREVTATIRKDHWKVDADEENHRRRSIYLFVRRNLRLPMLDAFDRPDTITSCPRRNSSTTALQSLVLLNSDFAAQAADDLAKRLRATAPKDVARQITLAYQTCLTRRPSQQEVHDAQALITSDPKGLRDFCLALFNLNEFAYLD